MIQHIYDESKRIMNGKYYENNWYFFHDALSLMKSDECRSWMQEKGLLKHWILSENDLNSGTTYANRPVGNSPELMPLYCSLFQDVILGLRSHIIYTGSFHKENPKKFSLATMKHGKSALDRLFVPYEFGKDNYGYPSEDRTRDDIDNIIRSITRY